MLNEDLVNLGVYQVLRPKVAQGSGAGSHVVMSTSCCGCLVPGFASRALEGNGLLMLMINILPHSRRLFGTNFWHLFQWGNLIINRTLGCTSIKFETCLYTALRLKEEVGGDPNNYLVHMVELIALFKSLIALFSSGYPTYSKSATRELSP